VARAPGNREEEDMFKVDTYGIKYKQYKRKERD
jgi:hypothetical protein